MAAMIHRRRHGTDETPLFAFAPAEPISAPVSVSAPSVPSAGSASPSRRLPVFTRAPTPPPSVSDPPRRRSHGFCIGHVVPEAQVGGPIALVRDGDVISVDAVKNTIELQVPEDELERRRAEWVAPPLKVKTGTLYKYIKNVEDASRGCVTDA